VGVPDLVSWFIHI